MNNVEYKAKIQFMWRLFYRCFWVGWLYWTGCDFRDRHPQFCIVPLQQVSILSSFRELSLEVTDFSKAASSFKEGFSSSRVFSYLDERG